MFHGAAAQNSSINNIVSIVSLVYRYILLCDVAVVMAMATTLHWRKCIPHKRFKISI